MTGSESGVSIVVLVLLFIPGYFGLGDRDEHSRGEERVNDFVALSKLDTDLVYGMGWYNCWASAG